MLFIYDKDDYENQTLSKLDESADYLVPFSSEEIEWDDIWDEHLGNWGVKDKEGNIIIKPQYDCCRTISYDLLPVAKQTWFRNENGEERFELHWGYIDKNGKTVIPFKFRIAYGFNKYGVAMVRDGYEDKFGCYLIDLKGNEIPGTRHPHIDMFDNVTQRTVAFAPEATDWENFFSDAPEGLYDTKERKVIHPAVADSYTEYDENHISVLSKMKETLETGPFYEYWINAKGEMLYPWLIGKGYNIVDRPNSSGYAIVGKAKYTLLPKNASSWIEIENKKYDRVYMYGIADNNGNLVIDMMYKKIEELEDNTFKCVTGDKVTVIKL